MFTKHPTTVEEANRAFALHIDVGNYFLLQKLPNGTFDEEPRRLNDGDAAEVLAPSWSGHYLTMETLFRYNARFPARPCHVESFGAKSVTECSHVQLFDNAFWACGVPARSLQLYLKKRVKVEKAVRTVTKRYTGGKFDGKMIFISCQTGRIISQCIVFQCRFLFLNPSCAAPGSSFSTVPLQYQVLLSQDFPCSTSTQKKVSVPVCHGHTNTHKKKRKKIVCERERERERGGEDRGSIVQRKQMVSCMAQLETSKIPSCDEDYEVDLRVMNNLKAQMENVSSSQQLKARVAQT